MGQPVCVTAATIALTLAAVTAHADDWDFVVAPYLVAPAITGDASVGRLEGIDVDVDAADIIDALELGGMIRLEAHHRSGFGANLDYSFMILEERGPLPADLGDVRAEIFQGTFEAHGSYRIDTGRAIVDLYAGLRWFDIDLDATATTPFGELTAERGDSWVDPLLGARAITPIANRWRFLASGDIGGFSIGSDLSWRVQGGVVWDAGDWFSLAVNYMALGVDRESGTPGTPDRFIYDTITHGPFIGFVFRL